MNHLAKLFTHARKRRRLSPLRLVQEVGYGNVNKGLRRLRSIESGEDQIPNRNVMLCFAAVLRLDEAEVLPALCSDFHALDAPIAPQVINCAIYAAVPLPVGCMAEEAVRIAKEFSRARQVRTCVRFSRIRSLYVEPCGFTFLSYSPPAHRRALLRELRDKTLLHLRNRLAETPVEERCHDEERRQRRR